MQPTIVGITIALLAGTAFGDEQTQVQSQPEEAQAEASVEGNEGSKFSVTIDATYSSQYFFRGIVQETDGFIFQPSIEIGFDLYEGDEWSLAGYAGMWNSFHSEETGSTDTDQFVSTWYEVDLYAGVSLSHDRFSFDVSYTNYASPNGAFGNVDEIGFGVSFDDSGLWGESDFALSPYASLAFEFSDNGADGGVDKGTFLAIGVEPGMEISDSPVGDVSISFPVEVGLSVSDYYEVAGNDETFGYLTAGVAASIPLDFMPDGYGEWSLSAGLDYLMLGDNTETINGGDDDEWIFHAGISVGF